MHHAEVEPYDLLAAALVTDERRDVRVVGFLELGLTQRLHDLPVAVTESVDALLAVADDEQCLSGRSDDVANQVHEHVPLQQAGVLELVDHQMAVADTCLLEDEVRVTRTQCLGECHGSVGEQGGVRAQQRALDAILQCAHQTHVIQVRERACQLPPGVAHVIAGSLQGAELCVGKDVAHAVVRRSAEEVSLRHRVGVERRLVQVVDSGLSVLAFGVRYAGIHVALRLRRHMAEVLQRRVTLPIERTPVVGYAPLVEVEAGATRLHALLVQLPGYADEVLANVPVPAVAYALLDILVHRALAAVRELAGEHRIHGSGDHLIDIQRDGKIRRAVDGFRQTADELLQERVDGRHAEVVVVLQDSVHVRLGALAEHVVRRIGIAQHELAHLTEELLLAACCYADQVRQDTFLHLCRGGVGERHRKDRTVTLATEQQGDVIRR